MVSADSCLLNYLLIVVHFYLLIAVHFTQGNRKRPKRPKDSSTNFHEAFYNKIGLNIGDRNTSVQSNFKADLIQTYASLHETTKYEWCPILQDYFPPSQMKAAHIFPWKHGQDMMDSIFGKIRPSELFSSRNGLLIHQSIEDVFDCGFIFVVPDLPEYRRENSLGLGAFTKWTSSEISDFKIKVESLIGHRSTSTVASLVMIPSRNIVFLTTEN